MGKGGRAPRELSPKEPWATKFYDKPDIDTDHLILQGDTRMGIWGGGTYHAEPVE